MYFKMLQGTIGEIGLHNILKITPVTKKPQMEKVSQPTVEDGVS